ncbi:MAG: DUF4261 domain-containing protein [Tannerellaceae bacterium]|nr:DUF4261 domain-containing protein [Tannerellaceae bacterium]
MLLFKDENTFDIQKVITHLNEFWGLETTDTDTVKKETAVFNINGQMVAIAEMPAPVPGNDIKNVASLNQMWWPTALEDLEGYERHTLVTVMSGNQPVKERFHLISMIIGSILMNSTCLGVYFTPSDLLLSRKQFLNYTEALKENEVPFPRWVYIGIRPNENNRFSLYTYGLKQFGKKELEIIESAEKVQELYDFIINIGTYIIEEDITLRDGETIGYSATHKIKIKQSRGVYLEGDTLKLEL